MKTPMFALCLGTFALAACAAPTDSAARGARDESTPVRADEPLVAPAAGCAEVFGRWHAPIDSSMSMATLLGVLPAQVEGAIDFTITDAGGGMVNFEGSVTLTKPITATNPLPKVISRCAPQPIQVTATSVWDTQLAGTTPVRFEAAITYQPGSQPTVGQGKFTATAVDASGTPTGLFSATGVANGTKQ
jgi:hypothetical protein